ncbi:hypothetical protein HK099_000344 [Clydaea vesicula]|uniref:Uncharacterized protein n=1 Tax=Clydaea vesicula TaxID=447962 RepID=A0AAD5TWT1_9FUNG|nr:hypothetical protein HK099_000344 [Clydaea vesicula]
MIVVRDWIEKHKEDLQKNDFDCAYMRSVMPISEVCFLLKRVLTNKTASFWRGVFTELRSRQVEVSLSDGKFEFAGELSGFEIQSKIASLTDLSKYRVLYGGRGIILTLESLKS